MYENVVLVVLLLYNVVVFLSYTTFCYMGLAFTKLLILQYGFGLYQTIFVILLSS